MRSHDATTVHLRDDPRLGERASTEGDRSANPARVAASRLVVDRRGRRLLLRHGSRGGIVVVPNQPGETLPPDTLKAVLDQAGLSIQEFRDLL